ncbi:MAG: T9SS type A sorting domain-containing protein [Bacteroidota bacterium]|nr:T9SS type A sorting domain-containing protein [Bacteroidota bacterium]
MDLRKVSFKTGAFLLITFISNFSWGQLSLNTPGAAHVIDFSSTIAGVSNGPYAGAGFQPTPSAGQLDSDAWAVTGWSDGALVFGGTQVTASTDYTRGTAGGAIGIGGFYSYTGGPGSAANPAFLIQPGGGDWAPGTLTLKILNNTGVTISDFNIAYDLFVRNDQGRANSLNFSYSTDGITFTPVAALNYTSVEAVDGLGYVQIGTSPSRSTTLSGVGNVNGAFLYIRWSGNDVSGAGSRDEFAIDNITITPVPPACVLSTEPSTDANNIVFSNIGCNGMTLSWTSGNGSNRIVVAKEGGPVSGTPTDQTTYTANANFGIGSILAAGEYVVYKGNGNTFTCFGLTASTNYYFKVFEFNGSFCEENYFTSGAPASANETTIACSQCPQLTGAFINSCDGTCSEGDNELLFLNSGSYSIPVSSDNIVVNYGTTNPALTTYTDNLTTNSTYLNALNSLAGCGTLFYDAMVTKEIPPNTPFIVMSYQACYELDFSAYCGNGPIYIVFTSDSDWKPLGNFVNTGTAGSLRYFRTDFSNFAPGCIIDYNYEPYLLTTKGDGDAISFPTGGGAASNYFNDNCTPPITILPISLIKFDATFIKKTIQLKWTTASETNNDFFTIERTLDGINFQAIKTIKGAGNSNQVINYISFDEKPEVGVSYYRLKQTDFDGTSSYSQLVAVEVSFSPELEISNLVTTNNKLSFSLIMDNNSSALVRITDILGKIMYNEIYKNNENYVPVKINMELFPVGFYILNVVQGNKVISRKFILK